MNCMVTVEVGFEMKRFLFSVSGRVVRVGRFLRIIRIKRFRTVRLLIY